MNIVFDFGNVLFEWNPRQLIVDHFPSAATLTHDPIELAKAITDHKDWQAFDAGHMRLPEVSERTAARLKLDPESVATFLNVLPHALPTIASNVEIVTQLLANKSHGHRLFFLSNMPAEYADVLEQKHAWIAGFEDGIFSGRIGLIKPDPAIFREAEKRFNLVPQETLFLDDVATIIAAARGCGWHAEQIVDANSVGRALALHGIHA